MTSSPDSIRDTLWAATALEPAHSTDPSEPGSSVAALVVAGGFTGLSAALAAAERGSQVALLEARTVRWGASGRNGGQVIPGLKLDPSEMIAAYGQDAGQRLTAEVGGAADLVFQLIQTHGIDCDPRRSG